MFFLSLWCSLIPINNKALLHFAETPTSSYPFTDQIFTEQLVSASPVLGTGLQQGRRQAGPCCPETQF